MALKLTTGQIRHIMEQARQNAFEEGEAPPDFPFEPGDVDCIHAHKIGTGDGVWYRLRDGRVFNSYGESSDSDPSLYDTVAN